jgi:hypothetical protein
MKTIAQLQSARINAANVLAGADAHLRNVVHRDSNASDDERREAYEARAAAQTCYDEGRSPRSLG